MTRPDAALIERLKAEWTDKLVRANPARPELARFGTNVGRVVTVNWNGRALVDFADGAWYDFPASAEHLVFADEPDAAKSYDAAANSAQKLPTRQG